MDAHGTRPGAGKKCWALLLAIGISAAATAQPFPETSAPPAQTPGGAQPFLGRGSLPTLAQENALPIPPALDIPPLIDRPLGLEEGPRVRAIEFRVVGVVERSEYGIDVAGITYILEQHLATQPLDGFTINQLQAIADDITQYYRSKGLILAQAFVPAQNVQNGVITLQLVEGTLGSVAVEGNKLYSTKRISGPFASLLKQPVDQTSIEEALLSLQDFPGLTVFGTFRRGQVLGDTQLLVSVRDEKRFFVTPSIDNYGSAFTGDRRGMVRFGLNNLAGSADQLTGYVLQTANPSNGTYGGLQYAISTTNAKNTVGFGASKNTFDVTDVFTSTNLDLHGTVKRSNVFYERRFANQRKFRAGGTLDLAHMTSLVEQPGINPSDDLDVLSYTFDYYTVGKRQRGLNLGFFRALAGTNNGDVPSRQGGSGAFAEGNYTKFEFNYQRLQRFGRHNALLLHLSGQQSNDLLVSLEQFSLGGPANVRAYPVAESLIDTGGAATLEWIIDAPGFADRPVRNRMWGDVFKLSLFYDYAAGDINDPLPSQASHVDLSGYGLGLQFSVSQKFYLRLDAAKPDSKKLASNGKDKQFYMSFSYTF